MISFLLFHVFFLLSCDEAYFLAMNVTRYCAASTVFRVKFIPLYNDNDPPYYVRSLNHSWRHRVRLVEPSSAAMRLPCISPGGSLVSSKRQRGGENREVPFSENDKIEKKISETCSATKKRKCRPRTTLFSLDFSRRYRISSFIDLIGGIPPIPNVFPISVTGFCDMTNARQINRVHYLPPDFKHFIHGKK